MNEMKTTLIRRLIHL